MRPTRATIAALLLVTAFAPLLPARASQDTPQPAKAKNLAGLHDFDFLVGEWQEHHRRRDSGGRAWEEFDGWSRSRALLGGAVNADDVLLRTPAGDARGVGVAAYDPETGRWGTWWLDGANPYAKLDPAALGGFENGVGTFYSDASEGGKAVRVRVVWSKITATSAHREQAVSTDGGKTWEPRWISDLTRVASAPELSETPKPTPGSDLSGLHAFDTRVGNWTAHHRQLKERLLNSRDWMEYDGTQSLWLVLGGYGNVNENVFKRPGGDYPGVTLRAYDPKRGVWSIWWLDDRTPLGTLDPPVRGRFEGGLGTMYSDDTLRGRPIKVRFTWSNMTEAGGHWEQAFSADGGKTWETNWYTDFARAR
jgi:hypothetical protein